MHYRPNCMTVLTVSLSLFLLFLLPPLADRSLIFGPLSSSVTFSCTMPHRRGTSAFCSVQRLYILVTACRVTNDTLKRVEQNCTMGYKPDPALTTYVLNYISTYVERTAL